MRQMLRASTEGHSSARLGSSAWTGALSLPQRHRGQAALRRRPVVTAETPRMRNLRGGGASGAQPQYGSRNGATAAPGAPGEDQEDLKMFLMSYMACVTRPPTGGQPLYRGNLSGPSGNVAPTTAVPPEDVLAANRARDPAAAASIATASQPVVKFVPKRISLFDAMKFNGPAPEIINSRLAMVGFVAGALQEPETGETFLQQATHLPPGMIVLLAVIVIASLQPILRAAKSEPFGVFTPRAEIINGRAAMLGFSAIAALEWNAGVCFF